MSFPFNDIYLFIRFNKYLSPKKSESSNESNQDENRSVSTLKHRYHNSKLYISGKKSNEKRKCFI